MKLLISNTFGRKNMHRLLLNKVVKVCKQRQREGDFPTIKAFDVETLEDAVVELAKLAAIAPDPECEAGTAHWEAPEGISMSGNGDKDLTPKTAAEGIGPTVQPTTVEGE